MKGGGDEAEAERSNAPAFAPSSPVTPLLTRAPGQASSPLNNYAAKYFRARGAAIFVFTWLYTYSD